MLHSPAAIGPAKRSLRILTADDEPNLARLTERILGQRGHTVIVETSAEQALEQLARGTFDVVASDLGLGGGMNGWDLAEQVRERWPGSLDMLTRRV